MNKQFCTFRVGDLLLGVQTIEVQEVLPPQQVTRVPLAHAVVGGLINLRGQIVTTIDLRRRLDLPDRAVDSLPMNLVLQTIDGPVNLLVDDIDDVVEVTEEMFEPPPETVDAVARECIRGVYKLQGRLLLVLDTGRTLELAENIGGIGLEGDKT